MRLNEEISRMKSIMGLILENQSPMEIYVDMGNVLFPSSGNDQVQAGTTERPTDVKGFQEWVLNTKKDNQILGKYGADGKWGKRTSNAWLKYGEEYKEQNPNLTTTDKNSQNFIGRSLWNYVKSKNPTILTSTGTVNPQIKRQNKLKQTKSLGIPEDKVIFVTNGTDKGGYAGRNKILIDDSPENIRAWVNNGGTGILHRSNDQTIKELMKYFQ